jgi:hypothetical protein
MSWQRFVLALDLDVEQPYPGGHKRHFDEGQPVLVNTEGRLYTLIRDRLRAEDGRFDRVGQAAVQLREWDDVPPRPGGRAAGLSG